MKRDTGETLTTDLLGIELNVVDLLSRYETSSSGSSHESGACSKDRPRIANRKGNPASFQWRS